MTLLWLGAGGFVLRDHQHVEDDHRRQAQDHGPDAQRPENVLGGKASLLFSEWIILSAHDAPALIVLVGSLIRAKF